MDWSLRACARRGHLTYAPDEPALRERLCVQTAQGPAWRCLRCEGYVLGDPVGHGPADAAPEVLRGRALRDATVLRLFAVERGLRAVIFAALAAGVVYFRSTQVSVEQTFDRLLPALQPAAAVLNIDLSRSRTVARLEGLVHSSSHTLTLVAAFLVGYAVVEAVEAVGLWSLQRWGEYVAVVATAAFLPIETYELVDKRTWLRIGAFVINLLLVAYLLWTKRLFGFRGGEAAFRAEREAASVLEIEAAAAARAGPGPPPQAPSAGREDSLAPAG